MQFCFASFAFFGSGYRFNKLSDCFAPLSIRPHCLLRLCNEIVVAYFAAMSKICLTYMCVSSSLFAVFNVVRLGVAQALGNLW